MIDNKGLCFVCNINNVKLKGKCRPCYQKDYNNKNKDKINDMAKLWASKHKKEIRSYVRTIKARYKNLKLKAKSRNINFDLSQEEYSQCIKSLCYYCDGFFPLPEAGGGLDRLNNKLGYHIDNVVACCTICNQTRNNNWTPEETKVIIQAGINFRKSKL